MSWSPNDLVTDQDLVDYEANILTAFNVASWATKRTKVLEDWVFPILRANGLDPNRLRTRFEADQVFAFTGAAYSDVTAAAADTTADDLNLATILATPASDAIFIGSARPFRGLHWRMLENISSVAGTLSVSYWGDAWTALTVTDATAKTTGKPFSGGGSQTWTLPSDWTMRTLNASDPRYWVKVQLTATPTGAKATQIGTIESSALRAPATFRTLMMIFREAPTAQRGGPWDEKAIFYQQEADAAMQRALPVLGREFDMAETPESDLIGDEEQGQTTAQVVEHTRDLLERG